LVFDGEGNQTYRYLHGTQIDQILAQEANGEVLWALTDNQGTVRDIVNNDGVVVNHITYDSFGKVTGESNAAVDFRFGYTGRELDAETGLYYYRARYYNPNTGRFLSEDPISFGGGDSNLYSYVFNSPVNYLDPSGHGALGRFIGGRIGAGLGSFVGGGIGGSLGASGGTLVAPGVGTVTVGGAGAVTGKFIGGRIGGIGGAAIGDRVEDFLRNLIDTRYRPEFNPNNINQPSSTPTSIPSRPAQDFPGTQLIPPGNVETGTRPIPQKDPLDLPNVTTFPGGSCSADYPYLAPPFFESGAEDLPNLTGKTREEAKNELQESGFEYQGNTPGGYEKWYHPDGSRVQIRPNGEVTRQGPKVAPEGGGNKYRPAIGPDGQRLTTPEEIHNTGEFLK
jgi:RHS repeat-associated protein